MLSKRLSRCVPMLITSEEASPPLLSLPTNLPDSQCALVSPKLLISLALFKLKPFNLVAAIFLPTFMAVQATASDVDKRIENMWRVHRNRTDRGLGGTKKSNGLNESSNQGHNFMIPNINISSSMLFEGAVPEVWNNNPFMRHHENIFQYSSHLYDIDDHAKMHFDTFERFKKFKPKAKSTVGASKVVP